MLRQRIITAAIGIPVLLLILLWAPSPVVSFFFLVFIGLSVFEISAMILPALDSKMHLPNQGERSSRAIWLGQALCITVGMLLFLVSTFGTYEAGRGGIVVGMSVLMLVGVFSAHDIDRSIVRLMGYLVSVCYGCLPWLAIWDLYIMGSRGRYILLAILIVMLNDTGAYFGGRKYGKRKLAPILSPKKTWEGALTGIAVGMVGAVLLNGLYGFSLGPMWLMALSGLVGGIFGILGDLVESAFKRFSGIKDSGAIFPGHGGFLDRVDSLLFAVPAIWFILSAYRGLAFLE
jgi:phosphatidate cytidylyltransferase